MFSRYPSVDTRAITTLNYIFFSTPQGASRQAKCGAFYSRTTDRNGRSPFLGGSFSLSFDQIQLPRLLKKWRLSKTFQRWWRMSRTLKDSALRASAPQWCVVCGSVLCELYRPIICTGCVGHSTFEYPEVLVGPGQAE